VDYLAGIVPQGRIGVGYAAVSAAREVGAASESSLEVRDVDVAFTHIAGVSGAGSAKERARALAKLMGEATAAEQSFLQRLLIGELRQGAQEGVMIAAIAKASGVDEALVRRGVMLASAVGEVAATAIREGGSGVSGYRLRLLAPVQPMLAQTAADVGEAIAAHGQASVELKLDGARIQVHRDGDQVRIFSRDGNDVTARLPEVVEQALGFPARSLILDGEVLAMREDGSPQPFQVTMRRFGRKLDVAAQREAMALTPYFFDVVHVDGADLLDSPYAERQRALADLLTPTQRVPFIVTASADEAERFYDDAVARGFEGVMVKTLDAPYEAGRRGSGWLKVKPAHTLDLVVLAAEWGSGRREGLLSNIHLGARDPEHGGFAMLGKTFKGMTDVMLAWQTKWFLEHAMGREGHVVHVKPELVAEIAFDTVQASTVYESGFALRFARVKRYREDKSAAEADTIEAIRAIFAKANRA
ncbi:MAG TPA: ATP-dependent DNA ligase, partial [Myxococcota bacterium]|nr:ATP-dependent DNA ligase [Myxococcota bacterium]